MSDDSEKKNEGREGPFEGQVLVGLKHETNVSLLHEPEFHGKLLLHFLKARPVLLDDVITECLYDPELKSEMRLLLAKIEEDKKVP